MKRKKVYQEGDWFAVPLRGGGYASGLVARASKTGTLLGYFFGPVTYELPSSNEVSKLEPRDAVLVRKFGDLGLQNGEWPIFARANQWDRQQWPNPTFGYIDSMDASKAFARRYDDDALNRAVSDVPISSQEARRMPEDGLSGHIALIIQLTKILNQGHETPMLADNRRRHLLQQ